MKTIADNYLDEEENPFFNKLFMQKKLQKRANNSLEKLLLKYNKSKTKQ